MNRVRINGISVEWLGYASFKLENDVVIYIDPTFSYKLERADIVLITHHHANHFNKRVLHKISSRDTVVICPYKVSIMIKDMPNVITVKPGDIVVMKNLRIWATPAYNVNKFNQEGYLIHPREELNVGYVIKYRDLTIYHTGDTDNIPELRGILCDVALLPIGGKCVMDIDEAVNAATTINPRIVIPMHYDPLDIPKEKFNDFIKRLRNIGIDVLIRC